MKFDPLAVLGVLKIINGSDLEKGPTEVHIVYPSFWVFSKFLTI